MEYNEIVEAAFYDELEKIAQEEDLSSAEMSIRRGKEADSYEPGAAPESAYKKGNTRLQMLRNQAENNSNFGLGSTTFNSPQLKVLIQTQVEL